MTTLEIKRLRAIVARAAIDGADPEEVAALREEIPPCENCGQEATHCYQGNPVCDSCDRPEPSKPVRACGYCGEASHTLAGDSCPRYDVEEGR
jgi:hypothetical protein